MELSLPEGRAIDIQSKANMVSGQSKISHIRTKRSKAITSSPSCFLKASVITLELLVLTSSGQFPRLCMSMALLHGSFTHRPIGPGDRPAAGHVGIPSEEAARGQGDERRQQRVADPVEVLWREGHHNHGQGQGEAGGQRQEFAVAEF